MRYLFVLIVSFGVVSSVAAQDKVLPGYTIPLLDLAGRQGGGHRRAYFRGHVLRRNQLVGVGSDTFFLTRLIPGDKACFLIARVAR